MSTPEMNGNGAQGKIYQLGQEKVFAVKKYLSAKWLKLGLCYRLSAFAFGMSFPIAFVSLFLNPNTMVAIVFLIVMVAAFIGTGKHIKEIYLIDQAQKVLASTFVDYGPISKTKASALLLGKTLAIAGDWIGGVMSVCLFYKAEEFEPYLSDFTYYLAGVIAVILFTCWIPFVLIGIRQLLAKNSVKKKSDKVFDMADLIQEEAFGNKERAQEIRSARHVPGAHGMQFGYAAVALSVLGSTMIIQPFVSEHLNSEEKVADSREDDWEKEEDTEAIMIEEIADSSEAEGNEQESVESENNETEDAVAVEDDYNPNGYGFSIGQDCLDVYLNYLLYEADSDYSYMERENGGDEYHTLKYFSIAGMAGEEPFLLLSSYTGFGCGDETYFVTYTPEDFSGEGIDQTHLQHDLCFGSCDWLSMRNCDAINTLYIWASNPKTDARFIHRLDMVYVIDYDDSSQNEYSYEGDEIRCNGEGKITTASASHSPEYYEEKLASGDLMEIKWFTLDQIEDARAYYGQYVREEVYDGPVETESRDAYFTDDTVLKYIGYISDGVFEVDVDEDGDTLYRFSCLESDPAMEIFGRTVDDALTFTSGSDSQDIRYFLIENADGSWTYIKRHWCVDKYGEIITFSYESDENEIIFWFNNNGANISSMDELISELRNM